MKKLTTEQVQIVDHRGNARVLAAAGAGKTSTLVAYAKARPNQRFLLLVYNRSVRIECIERFKKAGCSNVQVETAHSLAYNLFNVRRRFTLAGGGGNLKVNDVIQACGIQPAPFAQHLILGRHVQQYMNCFLNSDKRKLADLDYLSLVTDPKAIPFARKNAGKIYDLTYKLLSDMYLGKTAISHDGYLKFFSLSNPVMNYDGILLDEAQDANPVMLDIFLRQRGDKVMVGDHHQSIYGFRAAVNSLDKVDFPAFSLSTSFRFRQPVADLAMDILKLKAKLGQYTNPMKIIGAGDCQENDSYCVIARGNLSLLDNAIQMMLKNPGIEMCFEGDLNNYTYMSEGASLYDILNLRNAQFSRIRSDFMKSFTDFSMLEEYANQTGDQEISLMIEMVKKYNLELGNYIRLLRERQVVKPQADVVFATTHKAKGQEYHTVELCSDFITGDKIDELLAKASKPSKDPDAKPVDPASLAEEVNILYVAATRVQNCLKMSFDINDSKSPSRHRGLEGVTKMAA